MLSSLLLAVSIVAAGPVDARDAWIAEAPPGASVHAGYLSLRAHDCAQPVVLTGVSSERFGAIEIHTMESVDGKMRMRRLERIEIGCEQDTALSPGGKHLMLFRAVGRPERGARIPMRLEFEDGSAQTVEFEVRQR